MEGKMKSTRHILSISIFILFLIFGCAPSKIIKREAPLEPPEVITEKTPEEYPGEETAVQSYNRAEREYKEGRLDQALKGFEDFLTRFPSSDLVDDALFNMGEIFLSQGDYHTSREFFHGILQDFPTSNINDKTRIMLAISNLKLKNFQDSIQILNSLITVPYEEEKDAQIYILLAQNHKGLNENLEAISWYIKAIDVLEYEESIREVEDRVKEIINTRLSRNELTEIIYHYKDKFPSGYAQFNLAEIYFNERELDNASLTLIRMLDIHPEHEYSTRALELLSEINQRLVTDANTIGCILPLSENYSIYGEKILRGIELAIDVFTPSSKTFPIKLVIKDSKGEPETAANAVEELVIEENVICIIGPLLSITAESAAEKAEELEVPLMVLSQKKGIAEIGEYIFRNSLTPDLQAKTIVDYGTDTLGLKKFAILYPNNQYGTNFMNLFWNEVLKHGGEVVGVESYKADQTDFQDEIKKLGGLYYLEDRQDEIEEMKEEGDGYRYKEEKLSPVIDFDAIFIPDYYDKVGLIVPQLVYYDIVGIQLLGTNGWNSFHLIEMAGDYVQGAVFVDGFFKNSPYPSVQNFVTDFRLTFGEEPGILEAHGYDSANIIVHLIEDQGIESRDALKDGLYEIKDYQGVSGVTSFNETGDSDKTLSVLMIEGRNIEQLR